MLNYVNYLQYNPSSHPVVTAVLAHYAVGTGESDMLLVGNSHAEMITPQLAKSFASKHKTLNVFSPPGCLPIQVSYHGRIGIDGTLKHARITHWRCRRSFQS
uniref:SGNH domain-containing protein n=1 Tax=Ditylenchus dipsaci TaxID=166011 RepID=A0A915DG41_9BILA